MTQRSTRTALVNLLLQVSIHETAPAGFAQSVALLEDLNKWDTRRMDQYDFDSRLDAYQRLPLFLEEPANVAHLAPLIYHLCMDLHDKEYSLRTAALGTLRDFLKTPKHFDLLVHVLVPCIKASMKSRDATVRGGFFLLLGDLALYAHTHLKTNEQQHSLLFGDLCVLNGDVRDPEQDFFVNISHLQIHRRARALAKARTMLGSLSSASLIHIVLPLALHMVYESNKLLEQAIQQEGALLLGEVARFLSWSHYVSTLKGLLSQVGRQDKLEKVLIRTASIVIDNFHFQVAEPVEEPEEEEDSDEEVINHISQLPVVSSTPQPLTKIGHAVVNQILPLLFSFLKTDEENPRLRVPIVLAIVKVCCV